MGIWWIGRVALRGSSGRIWRLRCWWSLVVAVTIALLGRMGSMRRMRWNRGRRPPLLLGLRGWFCGVMSAHWY